MEGFVRLQINRLHLYNGVILHPRLPPNPPVLIKCDIRIGDRSSFESPQKQCIDGGEVRSPWNPSCRFLSQIGSRFLTAVQIPFELYNM
jgi:hypothetical protein